MTKLGLHHFDGGGVISGGSTSNPLSAVSGALTTQNSYTAAAPVQAGTIGSQETTLSGQLQNEAAGAGPNPAQTQYLQNAQGIAQGAAATNAQNRALNPGLAARQSSNAAVAGGQQAAGTAAAQQQETQLAAQGQEANLAGVETTGLTSANGINAQVSQNNANAVQNTQGAILSSLPVVGSLFNKGGMVKKYADGGTITGTGGPTFSNANNLPDMTHDDDDSPDDVPGKSSLSAPSDNGALGANPFSIDGVSNVSAAPAMSAAPELGSSAGIGSAATAPSLLEAAGPAALALAKGGEIGPQSHAGKWLKTENFKKGGKAKGDVPAMVSPGEETLTPKQAQKVAAGKADPLKVGERVPGKAKVKGDSEKNDIVPKMLKDGGMVIPRSVVQMHPDRAAAFVRNHLSKKGLSVA